jgi:hypothetical protein
MVSLRNEDAQQQAGLLSARIPSGGDSKHTLESVR